MGVGVSDWRLDFIWDVMVWALFLVYAVGVVVFVVWVLAWILGGLFLLWEKIHD